MTFPATQEVQSRTFLAVGSMVEAEGGIEGKIHQPLPDPRRSEPTAFSPFLAADVVTDVEVLAKTDTPQKDHGHQGRCLHLHNQTAFVSTPLDLASGLAKQTISGPGLADDVIPKSPAQRSWRLIRNKGNPLGNSMTTSASCRARFTTSMK